ncbi:2-phosphosulfolactate phosphatase [Microbacterium fluvii]|uniref:Probable 2-phosphosulfolactate phosphatase n=1 Tax=Microbacterium fluvii TaxID=415215 RepID=A0ABW2HDC2_9MICO|nr:2-phosphosulfolactate phosphatase [Microbacterium fluvii]MCU4671067.1 2-phosphosulfolactate phosphatase [Microbacterium fluvii]
MPESAPFDQSRYQVRLEWGVAGLARLAPAETVVVVDVLRFSTTVTGRLEEAESVAFDDALRTASLNGAAVADAAAAAGATVLLGSLVNATAVAHAVMAEQHRRAARTSIAVVAAGELAAAAGPLRVAVEDQLGAGAVVDALGSLGIDHTSPEAAVAGEGFRALRTATRHLLTASGSGQELVERGLRDDVLAATSVDSSAVVPVLRGGLFVAF